MTKYFISFLILTVFVSCNEQTERNAEDVQLPIALKEEVVEQFDNPKDTITKDGIRVPIYDFENFKPFLNRLDNKIHVINFWATWCKPCVAELPAFEELGQNYPDVEVTLVSLDFLKAIESSLIPFIISNKLQSEVIVLNEPDANAWIPQIDENWSGAIPATIIYKNEKSQFYEQSFSYEELEREVKQFDN